MRKYNHNISKKANESLSRREVVVRKQRSILTIVIFVFLSLIIFFGSGIRVMASSKADPASYNKYYKSIRIEEGDTLWGIAEEYVGDFNIKKSDYIREICELNHIEEDHIHAGEYIVISYYSKEVK